MQKLIVLNDLSIRVSGDDFISLTDMIKNFPDKNILGWLRSKTTLDYIYAFENRYNPNFKHAEFSTLRNNSNQASFKKIKTLNLISIRSVSGRYGDTKAHKDIAFEFAMWLDVDFKLWVVQEFQKMKNQEIQEQADKKALNLIRKETAIEYSQMCKTLEDMRLYQDKQTFHYHYSNEADLINRLICGMSSKDCKDKHGDTPRNVFLDKAYYFYELELLNSSMLKLGWSFEQRKESLQKHLVLLPAIAEKKILRIGS